MKTAIGRAFAAALLLAAIGAAPVARAAADPACIKPAANCSEWLSLPGTPMRALLMRSQPLDRPDAQVTRALVLVHGGGRDADEQLRHGMAAAFLAGALNDTVIVAPRYASNAQLAAVATGEDAVAAARSPARDALAENELNWVSQFGPRHWNAGGVAANAATTSYEVIDETLKALARKAAFPNLRVIVVAGHSSGGQFVSRYQMINRVHESLGVPVRYMISNAGAYTYLDALRPTTAAWPATVSSALPGYIAPGGDAGSGAAFAAYADARSCTAYDTWPYGLKARAGYAAATASDEQIRAQAASRAATFVFGELDVLPLVNFDISCNAAAQGASRLARGLAYARYLRERHAARHEVLVIPHCGHHTRCMLTAEPMLAVLFPKV